MSRAIFLGSFNPPHIGHRKCIETVLNSGMMDFCGIDHIHIIPAYQNPNKSESLDFWKRYQMCRYMFSGLSENVLVDDIEATIRPKYTYDLITHFLRGVDKMIGHKFWWIITEETFLELLDDKWFKSKELLRSNKFLILFDGNDICEAVRHSNYYYGTLKIQEPVTIHSTKIREMAKNGEDVSVYTCKEIDNLIKEEKLYR